MKLAILEERVSKKIEGSRQIPVQLARTGSTGLSGTDIAKKIGELFIERANVNLTSGACFWQRKRGIDPPDGLLVQTCWTPPSFSGRVTSSSRRTCECKTTWRLETAWRS